MPYSTKNIGPCGPLQIRVVIELFFHIQEPLLYLALYGVVCSFDPEIRKQSAFFAVYIIYIPQCRIGIFAIRA